MFGGNYYGGVEYAGQPVTDSVITKVRKVLSKIVMLTKNAFASMMSTGDKSVMLSKSQRTEMLTGGDKAVLGTKSDSIII